MENINAEIGQALLNELFDNSIDCIFTVDAATSRFLDVNKQTAISLGYSKNELCTKFYIDIETSFTDTSAWNDHVKHIHRNDSSPVESIYKRKDGSTFTVSTKMTFLSTSKADSILIIARDITDLNIIQRQHLISQAVIDQAPVGIALANENLELYYCNPKGLEMRGGNADKVVGIIKEEYSNWEVYNSNGEKYDIDDLPLVRAVKQAKTITEEFQIKHFSGKLSHCDSLAAPIKDGDKVIGGMILFQNINARKNAEAKVEELSRLPEENPNPVFRVSKNGILLYLNPPSLTLLFNNSRKKGDKVADKWVKLTQRVYKSGKRQRTEYKINNKVFLLELVPVVKDGYINVYGTDITMLKVSEKKLEKAFEETITLITQLAEKRDPYTSGHQRRVASLSKAIAKKLDLTESQIKIIYIGALLHDIGKIFIPTDILNKPGKLSDSEFRILKEHPEMGYSIINDLSIEESIKNIILQHHERLDGSGYPSGLTQNDIPIESRIVSVADVIEAMGSHRPYRPALKQIVGINEIKTNRGIIYDPKVVDACLELLEKDNFEYNC